LCDFIETTWSEQPASKQPLQRLGTHRNWGHRIHGNAIPVYRKGRHFYKWGLKTHYYTIVGYLLFFLKTCNLEITFLIFMKKDPGKWIARISHQRWRQHHHEQTSRQKKFVFHLTSFF
jgi:hypothetical protein